VTHWWFIKTATCRSYVIFNFKVNHFCRKWTDRRSTYSVEHDVQYYHIVSWRWRNSDRFTLMFHHGRPKSSDRSYLHYFSIRDYMYIKIEEKTEPSDVIESWFLSHIIHEIYRNHCISSMYADLIQKKSWLLDSIGFTLLDSRNLRIVRSNVNIKKYIYFFSLFNFHFGLPTFAI
jgi:hypothetical protein